MRLIYVMLVCAGVVLAGGGRSAGAELPFRVGAAAVKITPSLERTVYLAGFNNDRRATGVHDDLYARALVIEQGKTRIALVAVDLIGLSNRRIREFRKKIRSVPPENVVIACTHVHSGPDTLGLWGKTPLSSGRDEQYMKLVGERVFEAVERAASALQPASLRAGVAPVPPGIARNSREPIQDPDVHVLQFTRRDGKPIGTLVHFGCHPEVMTNSNLLVTADYPGYTLKKVEAAVGGTALFFNGALGGMVTPEIKEHSFAETQRVGVGVGAAALEAIRGAQPVAGSQLGVRRRDFNIRGENIPLRMLYGLGVIEGRMAADDVVTTEMARIDIGEVRMITVPGEVLPKPALELKAEIGGPAPLILSLGEDELGYLVDPKDWERKTYAYERSMSIGREAWPRIMRAARELLGSPGR